jgi:DNA-directed RNA polymerase subunit RPC12/RpoP
MTALKIGGKKVKLPDEYICNMCGFMFLSGETLNIFCPECGSSMVAKEVSYEEFLDEDAYNFNFKQMIF